MPRKENELTSDDTLKFRDTPDWWNLKQYDRVRQWTAARWLFELTLRRKFYRTSNKPIQLFIRDDEESPKNLVKDFYERIDKTLEYSQSDSPEKQINLDVNGLRISVSLTPIIKSVSGQINDLRQIIEDVTLPPDEKILLIQKWCPDLVTKRSVEHAFIRVDLDGCRNPTLVSFESWLSKKWPKMMGRPPSIGEQQYKKWTNYLAYLDLREWMTLLGKPSALEQKHWDVLLKPKTVSKTRPTDLKAADWLLSDEANGLLRAAAEQENYVLV